jgi:hypothetical protein
VFEKLSKVLVLCQTADVERGAGNFLKLITKNRKQFAMMDSNSFIATPIEDFQSFRAQSATVEKVRKTGGPRKFELKNQKAIEKQSKPFASCAQDILSST